MRATATGLVLLLFTAALASQAQPALPAAGAQAPPAPPPAGAAEALAQQADAAVVAAMHARADALAAQKQHGKALALRKELVAEWAPGDTKALLALGFVQTGARWQRNAQAVVLDRDFRGDAKVLKKLDQEWDRTKKDLAKAVERAAQALTAAGDVPRATIYWRRLLLLRPGDAQAIAAMALPSFDGHTGTPEELRLLRGGRALQQVVQFLHQLDVPVVPAERKHPLLEQAGLSHHGVRTEHFEIQGTLPVESMTLAAKWAERALLLSRAMFRAAGGEVFRPAAMHDILCVGDKPAYHKVLDACSAQFDADRMRFLKEDVDLAFVGVGDRLQRLYVITNGGDDLLIDVTARGVVQDAAGLKLHALWEGLGHATVGFLFDRTLSFFVEQQQAHTVTAWQARPLLPDMATWRQIATESAWAKNDTPTARLALLEGHKFTNEERVKAWAMADFVLRSQPELLPALQASKGERVRDEGAVAAEFQHRTGIVLSSVDDAWRDYWGKGEALREAMAAAPAGVAADVDGARALAFAISAARAAADVAPAGFVVSSGPDAEAAHRWLEQLVKHELDQKKDPKKKDLPPPPPPMAVGSTVLVWRGDDPAAAVAHWLAQPVVRDYLLDPGRPFHGCGKGKHCLVLDLVQPTAKVERGRPDAWPRDGQRAVRGSVRQADLGPGLPAALFENGWPADGVVGMPLSLHFHRELTDEERAAITCRVRAGGTMCAGYLWHATAGEGPRAAGCAVFVPKEPLPAGEVVVQWTVPAGILPKDVAWPALTFTVL